MALFREEHKDESELGQGFGFADAAEGDLDDEQQWMDALLNEKLSGCGKAHVRDDFDDFDDFGDFDACPAAVPQNC